MRMSSFCFLCFCLLGISGCLSYSVDKNKLDQILQDGVDKRIYTGVAAIVGDKDGHIIYSQGFGSYHYQDEEKTFNKDVTIDSLFDLASVSKVVATTSAVALLFQHGYLSLDDYVSKYLGSDFDVGGKREIKIRNCLLHNSGLQPDPTPWYWDPSFGCPQTSALYPQQDFSCIDSIYKSLLSESIQQGIGEKYVYSDIGFEVLQMIIGTIVDQNKLIPEECLRDVCKMEDSLKTSIGLRRVCFFEAFVRLNIFSGEGVSFSSPALKNNLHCSSPTPNWLQDTQYLLAPNQFRRAVPTLNDTGNGSYTHHRLQGQVSDGDCFAMGGFCGHAGVFSTGKDLSKFLPRLLRILNGEENQNWSNFNWLNATTLALFTTEYNQTQSSRAFGWTTNDPSVADYGFDNSCGAFSSRTFMHTGYSGTCVCADPVNNLWSVILTNRAYNCQGQLCPVGGSTPVKTIYKNFHDELMMSLSF